MRSSGGGGPPSLAVFLWEAFPFFGAKNDDEPQTDDDGEEEDDDGGEDEERFPKGHQPPPPGFLSAPAAPVGSPPTPPTPPPPRRPSGEGIRRGRWRPGEDEEDATWEPINAFVPQYNSQWVAYLKENRMHPEIYKALHTEPFKKKGE